MSKNINFAFFGTPDVASETLEILKQSGFLPSLIVTSPDAKSGRGMQINQSPVAIFAQENNIPCLKPEKLDGGFEEKVRKVFTTSSQAGEPRKAIFQQENMRESKNLPDFGLFIVVAYGKIIPENILNIPKLGSINIHYSLLPKYRGASPVESAILNGDTETGVTIQQMEYKMDAGAILAQEKTTILPDETAPELRKRLIKQGGELLVKTLQTPSASSHSPFAGGEKQNEEQATFCKKIKKEDGLINLSDDGVKNYNKFRAYAGWPRTFFFKDGKRIIITKARLENNAFIIEKIIPEGGKEVDYRN